MEIKSIKYEELKPSGSYLNVRYGLEITCDSSDVDRAYEMAKQIVDETHRKQFPFMYDNERPLYLGEDSLPVIQNSER